MLHIVAKHRRLVLGVAVTLLACWRLSRRPVTPKPFGPPRALPGPGKPPLLSAVLPALGQELRVLLTQQGEPQLAAQVRGLRIVDRCRSEDDFSSTIYVRTWSSEGRQGHHRTVPLKPSRGILILDVVDDKIAAIEVLYRNDVRQTLQAIA